MTIDKTELMRLAKNVAKTTHLSETQAFEVARLSIMKIYDMRLREIMDCRDAMANMEYGHE